MNFDADIPSGKFYSLGDPMGVKVIAPTGNNVAAAIVHRPLRDIGKVDLEDFEKDKMAVHIRNSLLKHFDSSDIIPDQSAYLDFRAKIGHAALDKASWQSIKEWLKGVPTPGSAQVAKVFDNEGKCDKVITQRVKMDEKFYTDDVKPRLY